jgi:hypothetical protein
MMHFSSPAYLYVHMFIVPPAHILDRTCALVFLTGSIVGLL